MYILNFIKFSATAVRRWLRCRPFRWATPIKGKCTDYSTIGSILNPAVADVVVVYAEVSIVEVQIVATWLYPG